MRHKERRFLRRTISTALALLLSAQMLPAARAASELPEGGTPSEIPVSAGVSDPIDEGAEMNDESNAEAATDGNLPVSGEDAGNPAIEPGEGTVIPEAPAEDGTPPVDNPVEDVGDPVEDEAAAPSGGDAGTPPDANPEPEEGASAPAAEDEGAGWNQEPNTSIRWKIEDGTLILDGEGPTGNYASKEDLPWSGDIKKITALEVRDGVTELGDRLVIGAVKLASVTLPDSLTAIGEGTFRQCAALKTITIPSSVTELGRVSFFKDTALTAVIWENEPGRIYTMGDQVFSDTALNTLTLPAVTDFTANKDKGPFTGCPDSLWTSGTVTYAGTAEECKALFEKENTGVTVEAFTVTCSDGDYAFGDSGTETPGPEEPKPEEPKPEEPKPEEPNPEAPKPEEPKPEEPKLEPIDPANPYTGSVGDHVVWTYDPGTKTLTLTGTGETYSYPSDVPPWYGRLDENVAYAPELENVVIGEGITKLGDRLFINSYRLASVTVPSTLTEIAQKTFMNCTSLVSLDLSAAPVAVLGGNLFNGCSQLERLTLPKTLVTFEKKAFEKTNLTEIFYTGTVSEYKALADSGKADVLQRDDIVVHCADRDYIYGKDTVGDLDYTIVNGVLSFSGTGAIPDNPDWSDDAYGVHTLVIRPGITGIGENAFQNFSNLREVYYVGDENGWMGFQTSIQAGNGPLLAAAVTLAASGSCGENVTWSLSPDEAVLTISGYGPMEDYRSTSKVPWRYSVDAVKAVVVEAGVTTLGDSAFQNCKSLEQVELPRSLERIGTYTFSGCYALTEITIPEGTRILAAKAFSDTKNLRTIYLPATLEAVDMKAFNYDTAIQDVYYGGTPRQWEQIRLTNSGKGNANLLNASLHCTGTPDTAAAIFSDVTGGEWYAEALDALVEDGYLTGGRFNGEAPATLEMVLDILYRRAGTPGMYANAVDWGRRNGLAAGISQEYLTAGELSLVLARTAAYNGQYTLAGRVADAELSAAMAWAEDLLSGIASPSGSVLTRAQAAAVLARYLQAGVSAADRQDEIFAVVRAALEQGGDGKLYILAPDLTESTKSAKTGDCTLIVFPNGQTMLIDSGVKNSEANVLNMMRALALTRLDYFVLTHPHTDHAGNALAAAQAIYDAGGQIGAYYYSGYPAPDNKTTESDIADFMAGKGVAIDRNVHAGQQWAIGGVTVDVLGPTEAEVTSGNTEDEFVNNVSIVLKMTYGSSTYLTGGDLYISQELLLIDRLGSQLQADVVKANHHGLYTSNSWEWLEAVSPLVMVTENDDVGSSVIAEAAPGMGIAYYSAGVDGDVLVVMDHARNYEVITQFDTNLRRNYRGEIGLPELPAGPSPEPPAWPVWPGVIQRPGSQKPSKPNAGSSEESQQPTEPQQPSQPEPEKPVSRPVYSDVAEDRWFAPAVRFVSERGLMVGAAEGRFEPDGHMTRAMMAAVLHRLAGAPASTAASSFADVAAGRWFAGAVSWTAEAGILTGTGSNLFSPDGLVTREQVAVMLCRMAAHLGVDTTARASLEGFSDRDAASSWAETALSWAVSTGILQGTDGQLMPRETATRAEIAAILMRFDGMMKQ